MQRIVMLLPFLIISSGLLVRILIYEFQPLSLDETIMLDIIRFPTWGRISNYLNDHETQMPLYYFLLYSFKVITGIEHYSFFRFFSILWGILGVWELGKISNKFFSKSIQIYTLLIVSFSFFLSIHSVEVRPYSFLFFISTLLTGELLKTKKRLLILVPTILILCMTHYYGVLFSLIAIILYLFFNEKNEEKSRYRMIFLFSLFFTSALYFSPKILRDFATEHSFRVAPSIIDIIFYFCLLLPGPLAVVLFCVTFLKNIKKIIKNRNILLLISLSLLPIASSFLVSILFTPAFEARYLIVVSPALIIIFSFLIDSSFQRYGMKKIVISLTVLVFFDIFAYRKALTSVYRVETKKSASLATKLQISNPGSHILSCGICLKDYISNKKYTCLNKQVKKDFKHESHLILISYNNKKCQILKGLEGKLIEKEAYLFKNIKILKLHYFSSSI